MAAHIPILIIISPLLAAFLVLFTRKYKIILATASIITSITFISILSSQILSGDKVIYHLGGWRGPLGISLVVDGLNFFFSLIVLGLGLLVIVYSMPERRYGRTYYFLLLISLSSMIGIIYTADIFNMYVFYELLALAVYLLIAYPKTGVTLRASFNYLIMGGVGLSFFLLGIGFLYAMTGTLDIFHIAERLSVAFGSSMPMVIMSFVLITTGIGIKVAVFPLHGWLPDAHSMAPSPVSALLSGVTVKIGIYVLIRMTYSIFSAETLPLIGSGRTILMVLGVVSLLFGASMALVQKDLKRLLAYSTINQLGIVLIGLGIGTELGLTGALFHVLNHAMMKSTLFFCAGIMIDETGTREVKGLSGFGRKQPAITFAFIIASLGMIGIPPVNGFASKWLIFLAAVEAGYTFLVVIILMASVIAAAYYFRVIQVLFSGPLKQDPMSDEGGQVIHRGNLFRAWPIYILVAGSLLLGLVPALGVSLVKPAVSLLLSGGVP